MATSKYVYGRLIAVVNEIECNKETHSLLQLLFLLAFG